MINRNLNDSAARRLTMVTEPYLACDDCFDQIDAYVEGLLSGRSDLTDEMRIHLAACSACIHEAWSLAELAASHEGKQPDSFLAQMEADLVGIDLPRVGTDGDR